MTTNNSTVIVLGARVMPNGTMSRTLRFRVEAAEKHMAANEAARCIVTGGRGADEPCTEAAAAREGLVQRGISAERILLEESSTTTLENLRFAAEIIAAHGLSRQVYIATQPYHMVRARMTARRVGLKALPLYAETPRKTVLKAVFREFFAMLKFLFTR